MRQESKVEIQKLKTESKMETDKNPKSETRNPKSRVPLLTDEPQTLPDIFFSAQKKHNRPDILNFKRGGEWEKISSEEVISRAENIALGLYDLGLRTGDRAAILSANSPEWTLSDAGCQFAGIIDVPIYTTLSPNSIEYILKDSGAKVLFLQSRRTFERIREILPECKELEKIVFFDAENADAENSLSLEELENAGAKLKDKNPELLNELTKAVVPNDVATLIYTSGTTGEPKGVMLSHQNIISNVIDAGENFTFSENDVPLSVLPLSHVFERSAMYLYIYNGMGIFYAESIDKVADNLTDVRPTIFVGVPRVFEKVYAKAKLKSAQAGGLTEMTFDWAIEIAKEYARLVEKKIEIPTFLAIKHTIADKLVFAKMREFFGGRLRACITGGASLSDEIYLIFNGAGISIMQGYGLTETSPVISTNNPLEAKLGSVGKPIRNTEVRIAADGEIEVSGAGVMLGYYNKPDESRKAFTDDGFFKTGDIGEIDADGFLKITDRKKELFKTSGGKYIAPSPVEQMIKSSRFVSQVVLVGNERKFPAALIVPDFEQLRSFAKNENLNLKSPKDFIENENVLRLFEKEVERHCTELSNYEKVKKIALLKDELTVEGGELTPTLKIKRRVVDEKYKEVIDKIYADAERGKSAE
ncbi:MAG: long-chain fatty acid--CoA ligase [Pyrinomonadaceae bacterium]